MPEDKLNQQFRRSAQEGRENLAQLVKRIEEWRSRVLLPARGEKGCEMERVAKRLSRAAERLGHLGVHPHLDVRMRARRARETFLARQSRYDKLGTEFGHLADEARATLQGLRPALRANIDETVLLVVITEQGENRNQCEEQRNLFGFSHGLARRGT
jgi:hypothetical protein